MKGRYEYPYTYNYSIQYSIDKTQIKKLDNTITYYEYLFVYYIILIVVYMKSKYI